jgi:cyclopropane fatty-acyl-phospholipid synthase-like methyltransferase
VNGVAADWLDIARSGLTFNAPLSEARSRDLVARIQAARPSIILDLGCGHGELLLMALAATPAARGTGVDTDDAELARARLRAAALGVAQRCELVHADAASWSADADAVIVSGASQAFGGYAPMLTAVRDHLPVGGLAIVGEAVWAAAPTEGAQNILGELPSADDVRLAAASAGLTIEQASLASQDEWDEFESGFRSSLERSDDAELRAIAQHRRREYEQGYRGIAGYLWLVARG